MLTPLTPAQALLLEDKRLEKVVSFQASRFDGDEDDLKQECWLAASKAAKRYDSTFGVPFHLYAKKCIYKHLITYTTRQHDPFKAVSLDEENDEGDNLHDVVGAADARGVEINGILQCLEAHEQTAIRQYFWQRETMRGIASNMGFSSGGTVCGLLQGALKKLEVECRKKGITL